MRFFTYAVKVVENSAHLTVAMHDEFVAAQLGQAHGAAGVELLGGNTHLTAQAELTAVGEAGGDIHIHGRASPPGW